MLDTCSFCGKKSNEVAKLVDNGKGDGPGAVAICNEFAQVVLDIVEDEKE